MEKVAAMVDRCINEIKTNVPEFHASSASTTKENIRADLDEFTRKYTVPLVLKYANLVWKDDFDELRQQRKSLDAYAGISRDIDTRWKAFATRVNAVTKNAELSTHRMVALDPEGFFNYMKGFMEKSIMEIPEMRGMGWTINRNFDMLDRFGRKVR
jgi:hypothetical protein